MGSENEWARNAGGRLAGTPARPPPAGGFLRRWQSHWECFIYSDGAMRSTPVVKYGNHRRGFHIDNRCAPHFAPLA